MKILHYIWNINQFSYIHKEKKIKKKKRTYDPRHIEAKDIKKKF